MEEKNVNFKYDFNYSFIKINDSKFKVYAHKNELLNHHIIKTLKIFNILLDRDVIFNFYNDFYKMGLINLDYDEFLGIINNAIEFHDIGKLSFNFQINRLNKYNYNVKSVQEKILHNNNLDKIISHLEINHSFISALSFISKNKGKLNDLIILILTYVILGHHTNIKDIVEEDDIFYNSFDENKKITLKFFSKFLKMDIGNQYSFQKFEDNGTNFFKI